MKSNYFKYENYPEHSFPVYSSVRKNEKNVFDSHFHKDAEIMKIVTGTVCVTTGTKEYVLNENDIIFFSPFSMHRGLAMTDEVKTHAITFDPDILKKDVDYSYTTDTQCLFTVNHPKNTEIAKVFDEMFNVYWNKTRAYKLRITANLMQISAILIECGFISSDNSMLEQIITLPAIEYIKANYNCEIRISDLAAMLNFCPEHFTRVFKKEHKKTPTEYITDYRIGEALKLISQNRYSVSEIAGLTGFSSSSHFIDMFKKRLNTTPGKYNNRKE